MTITKITRAWAGTNGDRTNKGRTYQSTYRVETDSAHDQTKTIVDYFRDNERDPDNNINIPYLNSSYEFGNDADALALCHSISPKREDNSQTNWVVDFDFKTAEQEEDETKEDEKGKNTNNPLDWRWTVDISFADYSRPVFHATYRGGHTHINNLLENFETPDGVDNPIMPPMNSAGTIFDPPLERNAMRQIFRFGKYRHEYPEGMADNWRAVNSEGFNIKIKDPNVVNKNGFPRADKNLLSWHFDPFQVQVASANATVVRKNNMTVWQISSEIHCDYEFGFRVSIPDRGLMALAAAGSPDGLGGQFAAGNPAATGIAEERSIRDKLGAPLQEPVLLNGNGQPLPKDEPAIYLKWSIYPEVKFNAFNEWLPIDPA